MEYTIPTPVTVVQMCSVASEMTGNDVVLRDYMEQEESSIMESPKNESSEWTDEKHSLYLKSMEASFVDQLYNSSDMQSRKIHGNTHYPSSQFKVLQHGSWSKINFRRENFLFNEADKHRVSLGNPWIQHFRNGAIAPSSPHEKPSYTLTSQQFPVFNSQTSCSNTEVTDQNFVEEDSVIEKVNTPCSKKRMRSSVVSLSDTD